MEEAILKYLACPVKMGAKTCRSELILEEVFSYFKSSPKEIKEGYLKCNTCGVRFPIFFGIPVLINDLPRYLRNNFCLVLELSKRFGQINRKLLADSLLLANKAKPKEKKELFAFSKSLYVQGLRAVFEDNYIVSHYDSFPALAKSNEPLYGFLKQYQNKTPHLVLEKFLKLHSNGRCSSALEVGCNVGGFLVNLAQNAGFVFGLDHSFGHLFFTSCLLKHLPKNINQYKVIVETDIKKKRRLKIDTVNNLALIVGKGDNLPFRNSSVSVVSSCNLIDVVDNPLGLLKEKVRVLKKNGLILSSDPYQFLVENKKKLRIRKSQTAWQRIQEVLTPKIKILTKRDYIPWVVRGYQRNYNIFYNHTFCGRKVG